MAAEKNRTKLLRQIRDEVISLKSLPLYENRIKNRNCPVIGEGSHFAEIMLVGEAPGRNEAKTGRPFCGASGKILDELLESAGIKREEVYITNIIKDRPPFNRDPLPEEIKAYGPFLDRQIGIIKPKTIGGLGRFSARYLLEKFGLAEASEPISAIRGKALKAEAAYGEIKIIPFYHPAVAVYNPAAKSLLEKDFQILAREKTE